MKASKKGFYLVLKTEALALAEPHSSRFLLTSLQIPVSKPVSNSSGNSLDAQSTQATLSVAVLAEISLRPPQKVLIFIVKKYVNRIKVSKNKII